MWDPDASSEDILTSRLDPYYYTTPVSTLIPANQTANFSFLRPTVKWNLNDTTMHYKLNILEHVSTALVFLIVVVHVFVTAFGVHGPVTKE